MKRILLVGAGHAHLVLLRAFKERPLYGARVTLISPQSRQPYSGMLPGLLAGHYGLDEISIDVAALAERAHAEFVPATLESLDPDRRLAILPGGREIGYDLLSLNIGSLTDTSIAGSAEHALPVKPLETFFERLAGAKLHRIAIAGAGAAGAELAMALRHRGAQVTLYSAQPSMAPALAERAARAMRGIGVDLRPGMPVDAVTPGPVVVAGPASQAFDLVILATGPAAVSWPRAAGLACDERGFLLVHESLQSLSHPEVFAAGDCASIEGMEVPKSGVYSVRQGEALERSLRNLVQGRPPSRFRPQRRALYLLTCGARYAIAQRGGWTAEGRWVWWWKDRIDRRWMRSLSR